MLTVRAATPDDAAQISSLMTPLIVSGRFSALQTPFDADETFTFLSTLPARALLRVAEDGAGQILGLQEVFPEPWGSAHCGDIGTFVRLGNHRKGVGAALIDATTVAAKSAGYHKFTARIRADNAHGLGYYAKNGFEEVGRLREHIRTPGGFVAQVLMERML